MSGTKSCPRWPIDLEQATSMTPDTPGRDTHTPRTDRAQLAHILAIKDMAGLLRPGPSGA